MTLYVQNVVLTSNLCIRFIHFGAFPEESITLPNLQALPRMLVLPAAAKSPKSAAALKIHKICGCPQNPLVFKPLSYLLTLHTLQAALFISLG